MSYIVVVTVVGTLAMFPGMLIPLITYLGNLGDGMSHQLIRTLFYMASQAGYHNCDTQTEEGEIPNLVHDTQQGR